MLTDPRLVLICLLIFFFGCTTVIGLQEVPDPQQGGGEPAAGGSGAVGATGDSGGSGGANLGGAGSGECGQEALPCCPGTSCDTGLLCAETVGVVMLAPGCGKCGGGGQICCGDECNVGLTCTTLSSGIPWCITDDLAAMSLPGGQCTPPADGTEACDNGATCVADGAQPYCLACGMFNYFCCPGGSPTGACDGCPSCTCQNFNAFTYVCKP